MQKLVNTIKKQNGITLVALVVTIVVLLILAGITIAFMFGDNGILNKAEKTEFINEMQTYRENTATYVTSRQAQTGDLKFSISVGLDGQDGVKTILPNIKAKYEDQVIVQANTMYYVYVGTSQSRTRVKWCFENGIPVWGYSSYEDFLDDNKIDEPVDTETEVGSMVPSKGEYKKVGNIYMNTPDLSNFDVRSTYYVTYDENGANAEIKGRIDRMKEPSGWYDYEKQQWANVVTVNEYAVAYWTWIPKFAYKTIEEDGNQSVDAKFISEEGDIYKDSTGKEISLEGYKISDAFTFGGESLAGYWISKYELSEDAAMQDDFIWANNSGKNLKISLSSIAEGTTSTDEYKVFIDGENKYTGTLPYVMPNTKANKLYDIVIVDKNENILGRKQKAYTDNIKIDFNGLNVEATYYVKYDENGENAKIENRIDKGKAPSNWYNYSSQRWANIVTVTDEAVTYWTYIPRYQYATTTKQAVDVEFIGVDKTVPDAGYQIPDSFTFNDKPLAGYWISKYEISEWSDGSERIECVPHSNSLEITTNKPNGEYRVYIDGVEEYTGILPYELKNLPNNYERDIMIVKGDNEIIGRKKYKPINPIEIDLEGLIRKLDNGQRETDAYYVYKNEDGTENTSRPITEAPPDNWYDYTNKEWANIVTKANDTITYWTYIPRFEYKAYSGAQETSVVFIPKDQTVPDKGYTIPESFTFGGKNLAGYWISKYEVSEKK